MKSISGALRLSILAVLAALQLVVLGGCGGSDGAATPDQGSLVVSAIFDPIAKNVPGYADHVRLTITLEGQKNPLAPKEIQRPGDSGGTGTLKLTGLPAGRHVVKVEALTSDDKVVAISPNVGFLIRKGLETELTVSSSLNTTVDRISIDNAAELFNPGVPVDKPPFQLGARALDDKDVVLLQNPGNGFKWSCDNNAVATITEGGVLKPEGNGTANITVTLDTPSGVKTATAKLKVTGPVGDAGFVVQWGPVNLNKSVPGYVKGVTATLLRNNVELITNNFNRQGRTDAFDLTAIFTGQYGYGNNYQIRIEGKSRENNVTQVVVLDNVTVPFDSNNPPTVSDLGGVATVVLIRTDTIGIGQRLEEGEVVELKVGDTMKLRAQGETAAGTPVIGHADIAVLGPPSNDVISVSDQANEATVTANGVGTATITATADGGPTMTITVNVIP